MESESQRQDEKGVIPMGVYCYLIPALTGLLFILWQFVPVPVARPSPIRATIISKQHEVFLLDHFQHFGVNDDGVLQMTHRSRRRDIGGVDLYQREGVIVINAKESIRILRPGAEITLDEGEETYLRNEDCLCFGNQILMLRWEES